MLHFFTKGDFRGVELQKPKHNFPHPQMKTQTLLFFVLFLKIVAFPRASYSQGVQEQQWWLLEATL